ncbi:MAG: 30S ribosomal protein S6 [Bacillota bacterium]
MRQYETMYIVRTGFEEERLDAAVERFRGIVEEQGGVVDSIDRWGKRRLAYEIEKEREGHYVVMRFKAEAPAVKELDRVFKISGDVLRHIIIRED